MWTHTILSFTLLVTSALAIPLETTTNSLVSNTKTAIVNSTQPAIDANKTITKPISELKEDDNQSTTKLENVDKDESDSSTVSPSFTNTEETTVDYTTEVQDDGDETTTIEVEVTTAEMTTTNKPKHIVHMKVLADPAQPKQKDTVKPAPSTSSDATTVPSVLMGQTILEEGSYSYSLPDGKLMTVKFVIDEKGYRIVSHEITDANTR